MNAPLRCSLALAAAMLIAAAARALPGGGDFEISWHSIDAGGGAASGGGFGLTGTIGQPDAGAMSGGGYALVGGFWAVESSGGGPCAGDVDGSGVVDVQDLVLVILAWGTDGSMNGGDVDGSGLVDVGDLVAVILAWGPCPP